MKRKMKKKLIAFMLCMVLVICNSVSILADTPAAATTTAENQVSETKTAKNEKSSEENKSTDDNDTSKQSEETDETKDEAPEATTTEKKEETTEASTEKKDEISGTTTKAKDETEKAEEGTTEATTKKKDDTEAADETSESSEKKETTTAENSSETSGTTEETTEAAEETTTPTELTYENDDVKITVSANAENAIPEGATLQVVPVVNSGDTAGQYQEVEQQLGEKATEEEYDITGFLAYDISLIDEDGNEIEPDGEVQVSMDYKNSVSPVAEEKALTDSDVTVMHLEEDENGQVKEVVDMAKSSQLKNVERTTEQKIKKVEFVTDGFSIYALAAYDRYPGHRASLDFYYVDEEYDEIEQRRQSVNVDNNTELREYVQQFKGYEFVKICVKKENQYIEVQSFIYTKQESNGWYPQTYYYYTDENNNEIKATLNDVYIVYKRVPGTATPGGDNPELDPLQEPLHRKYIKYNGDKDYTLTLDVTGDKGDEIGVDVLLVLDRSGSMDNNGLTQPLKNAVETITDTILTKEHPNNKMAAISFSSMDYINEGNIGSGWGSEWNSGDITTSWVNYQNKNSLTNTVNWMNALGGTNWQYAMQRADEKLSEQAIKNDNNRKYVIFISDGSPTFRFDENGEETGDGNATYDSYRVAAVEEAVESANLKNAYIYSMYLTNGTADSMKTFSRELDAAGLYSSWIDGTGDISTALDDIVSQIMAPVYKNVVIIDTLSDYVQLKENPNYKVTVTKANGFTATLEEDVDYTIEKTDVDGKTTITCTLLLPEADTPGALDDDATYSLSFDVETTEKAEQDFGKLDNKYQGYPVLGDDKTDAIGNSTSSGQPGFYANDSAEVSYVVNEDPDKAEYDKPVVQVQATKVDVRKVWEEGEESIGHDNSTIYVGLYKKVVSNGEEEIVPVTEGDVREGYQPYRVLNSENIFKGVFEGLPNLGEGETYVVKELRPIVEEEVAEFTINVDGEDIGYIGIDSNGIYTEGDNDYEVTYSTDNKNVRTSMNPIVDSTITNTLVDSVEIEVKAKKEWNYPEGLSITEEQISHDDITVGLYTVETTGDGTVQSATPVKDTTGENITAELTEENNFTASLGTIEVEKNKNGTYDTDNYRIFEVVETGNEVVIVKDGDYIKVSDNISESSDNRGEYQNIYKSSGGATLVEESTTEGTYVGEITNTLVLGSIKLTKTDSTGQEFLSGAKFKIERGSFEDEKETGENGLIEFTNLLPGTYTITEIQSPEGYSLLANPIEITVGITDEELGNVANGIQPDKDKGYSVIESSGEKTTYYYDWGATVKNNKLFTMPEAGGRNIFMMTLAGTAMIALAAGSTIYYRRRRGVHNKTRR